MQIDFGDIAPLGEVLGGLLQNLGSVTLHTAVDQNTTLVSTLTQHCVKLTEHGTYAGPLRPVRTNLSCCNMVLGSASYTIPLPNTAFSAGTSSIPELIQQYCSSEQAYRAR